MCARAGMQPEYSRQGRQVMCLGQHHAAALTWLPCSQPWDFLKHGEKGVISEEVMPSAISQVQSQAAFSARAKLHGNKSTEPATAALGMERQ